MVSELTRRIVLGTLKPGDKLPSENTFVKEYGVSRTVVREALSRLQASGLVETHHGKGTFVLERVTHNGLRLSHETANNVRGVLELRLGLETQAVALAALRRTDAQLAEMRQALDDYETLASTGDSCAEPDKRFHLLIAEATGNPYFTDILLHLGNAMIPRSRIAPEERGDSDLSRQAYLANLEHEAIYNAIRRQDTDAARAAMWTHLTNSRERFTPESET
ncbi:GntR family transcriptional regulator [Pseudomonas matsuisoli]|uniref:GntR family transcriptional regulator n=2 Tax=Pseudomonas matsuisoli TaxID=1515666 RepID=A0A917PXC8_9PSED|nr:GntR family transcriptional regulator [Pseudomonas matsuisoli]